MGWSQTSRVAGMGSGWTDNGRGTRYVGQIKSESTSSGDGSGIEVGGEDEEIDVDEWRSVFANDLMTHKYKGSIIVLSISKSVEPNEDRKEMISSFQQGILCKH